ncbi:MAG: adenine nucleotide alpha hydrolase [Nitrososphaerota archaeon]|nr:adenine nucleotide alpha hydrolase [Nitrososphaerota archaeon]
MNVKKKALLSWSGGKDSSLCLYELQNNKSFNDIEVEALLTTLTRDYNRVSMHGVRRDLLLAQSQSVGIPLEEVWIPSKASNQIYQAQMMNSLSRRKKSEVSTVVFGDLFLEDIRKYREEFLGSAGFKCLFPIWGRDTKRLAQDFIDLGFKAIICTLDPNKLDPKFCGREFDNRFLAEIPSSVDPCGENGEFHTFAYGGPIFRNKINVELGAVVQRDGFYFADILLA